jgi:predicted lactoylglutathione lyase
MATKIFVNLPVKDLNRSVEFFTNLGFKFNPQFTEKEISDATKRTEVIVALSADSRENVDGMINKVIRAGGIESMEPQDHGWLYGRSFQDIDGHLWEVLYMDSSALNQG